MEYMRVRSITFAWIIFVTDLKMYSLHAFELHPILYWLTLLMLRIYKFYQFPKLKHCNTK